MSTNETPSLYTHSISFDFPSHTPPQSAADSEAHRRWKASLSGKERVEYEKRRIEAMTNTMIRDLRGVSPLCTAPGFYTSKISREHPWPWYSEPRTKEEHDEQVATHFKIYSIKTREEQNCFYMSLRDRENEWKKEQARQSQGTRKVTEGRASEDDVAVPKGSSRGKKSLADKADQSTFKEEYLSPAAYENACSSALEAPEGGAETPMLGVQEAANLLTYLKEYSIVGRHVVLSFGCFEPSDPLADIVNDDLTSLHPTAHKKVLITIAVECICRLLPQPINDLPPYQRKNTMPQSNNEEVYIPYISDEYPSSFPPGDNDEGQAWLQWQLTLNPDQKATYNRHLDEAIKRYSSSAASERQSRPHLPNGFSTKRISKEFNFPWGSEKIDERVASYIEVYKLNAAQMSRFNADREKSVARWELTQSHSRKPVGVGSSGRTTEGEDRPRSSDCGEMATIGDEDDDEIYSDDSDITIRG